MTGKYELELVRPLTPEEVSSLAKDRFQSLAILNTRYLPELQLGHEFPVRPEYLDAIRTSWMLDSRTDKPPYITVVRALGYALGVVLNESLRMSWHFIKDSYGESISMIGKDAHGGTVSVLPFSYVEKREHVQNAEVFIDLFALLKEKLAAQSA
jgi:hypothetical protein